MNASFDSFKSSNVNTVTFTSIDGKSMSFPLDYLIERGAVIASEINGQPLSESVGGSNQLWIPGSAGKYFIRDIVKIDFTAEEEAPPIPSLKPTDKQFSNRPNVSAKVVSEAPGEDGIFVVGEPILFEGYADDYDRRIVSVQFSLDDGETWATHPCDDAEVGKWVYWSFAYAPKDPGAYQLKVRAVNEDGKASPVAAIVDFAAK